MSIQLFAIKRIRTGQFLKVGRPIQLSSDCAWSLNLVEDPNAPVIFTTTNYVLACAIARRRNDDSIYQDPSDILGFDIEVPLNFKRNPDYNPVTNNDQFVDDNFEIVLFEPLTKEQEPTVK